MKKIIYSALACGAVLSLASCASDEPLTPGNGDGVQLTISLPDAMMTRASNAFGDGLDAVNLTYAVYNSKGTLIMSETKASFFDGTNLTNTLTLDLLNGETYNIIFWADAFGAGNTESPFIFSTDDKTVTVNYLKMGANSEKYDAFYASDDLTVNGPVSKTIKLYRPFAQINFGTNDLDKPAVTKEFGEDWANLQTTYTVSGLANTLNLATGEVSQNTDYGTSYTAAVGIPTGQAFPKITVNGQTVTGLKYLQMDYILAGKGTNDIAEFDLEIANSQSNKTFNTIKVPNAPYQANYRTNIYGQLLTTTNDFVVEIVPIFDGDLTNLWDGNPNIVLNGNDVMILTRQLTQGLTVSGKGTLNVTASVIAPSTDGQPAITLADGAEVTLNVVNSTFTGAKGADAVRVPASAKLTVTGSNSSFVGNKGFEYISVKGNTAYSNTTDDSFAGTAGSGIGNLNAAVGQITIKDATNIVAEGYGAHAFGIGGQKAVINIEGSTIKYARGGFAQPLCLTDTKYGKTEPEGGAAIGVGYTWDSSNTVKITDSKILKADGGSKAAAIGSSYWTGVNLTIIGSQLSNITGGNASAAVGSSRISGDATHPASNIVIENSSIQCLGGQFGAGIGSGYNTNCTQIDNNCNNIQIKGNSTIAAVGGKYAAGIGTGFHVNALMGFIEAGVNTTGTKAGTPDFYKAEYTTAEAIGYGVCDPNRELKDVVPVFKIGDTVIALPTPGN